MTHLLMDCSGDGWPIAALTPDQAAALDLAAGQHALPPHLEVIEVPDPPSLRIEPVGVAARGAITVTWDGSVAGSASNLNNGFTVERRARIVAGDLVLEPSAPPTALTVNRWPLDLDYKPWVTLVVEGPDPDATLHAWNSEREALFADPAGAVLAAWAGRAQQLGYLLGRPENAGLVARARAAGL